MATETETFNGWGSSYGLGAGEFDFRLWIARGGVIREIHSFDIRTLPNRGDLLARMPKQWRVRFLRDAQEARKAS